MDLKNQLIDAISLSKKGSSHPMRASLAYAAKDNFLGRVVDGYSQDVLETCFLTKICGQQLCKVHDALHKEGFGLFVFDAFRPLRAVSDFVRWAKTVPSNPHELERKKIHYPDHEKQDLFRLGYIADQVSSHCFGSAVDLSLFCLKTNALVDMGTVFDFFGHHSHQSMGSEIIGEKAYFHRNLLKTYMQEYGFLSYPLEWWHFDYSVKEIDTPLDFSLTDLIK
jgi:D-alanyl-D-alanine dipeptidase